MARTLLLAASLAAAVLLAPGAQAGLVIPPVGDLPKVVAEYAPRQLVVGGQCLVGECLPTYCIPPVAPCNPIPIVDDILGDILP